MSTSPREALKIRGVRAWACAVAPRAEEYSSMMICVDSKLERVMFIHSVSTFRVKYWSSIYQFTTVLCCAVLSIILRNSRGPATSIAECITLARTEHFFSFIM